jgi:hypothetical protein
VIFLVGFNWIVFEPSVEKGIFEKFGRNFAIDQFVCPQEKMSTRSISTVSDCRSNFKKRPCHER